MATVCTQDSHKLIYFFSREKKAISLQNSQIFCSVYGLSEIFSVPMYFYELQGQIMQAELGNSV